MVATRPARLPPNTAPRSQDQAFVDAEDFQAAVGGTGGQCLEAGVQGVLPPWGVSPREVVVTGGEKSKALQRDAGRGILEEALAQRQGVGFGAGVKEAGKSRSEERAVGVAGAPPGALGVDSEFISEGEGAVAPGDS